MVGPTNLLILNVRAPMPFVCLCSCPILILAYHYRPLYHLLHRVIIKKNTSDLHLSWVSLFLVLFLVSISCSSLVSFVTVLQHTPVMKYQL